MGLPTSSLLFTRLLPLFFLSWTLTALTCDLSAFVPLQWGVRVLDILWHRWRVKEQSDQPHMQNTLSGQLMSHQIKENYRPSVALMWRRDTAVTPEQCQDKCHTITEHNTTLLWPLNNLSLNFNKDINQCPNPPAFNNPSTVSPHSPFHFLPNLIFSPVFMVYTVCVSEMECNGLRHKQTRTDYERVWQLSHSSLEVSFGLVICEFILVYVPDCHNTAALMHIVFPTLVPLLVPYLWFMRHVSVLPVLSNPNPLPLCQRYFTLFLRSQLEKYFLSEWTCLYNWFNNC